MVRVSSACARKQCACIRRRKAWPTTTPTPCSRIAPADWIGAWERGLSRIQNGRITNFTTAQGLVNGLVMALAEDQTGRLWISARDTTNGGLAILENDTITRVTEPIVPDGAFVAAIYQGRDGAMWFGTSRAGALCRRRGAHLHEGRWPGW